MPKLTKKFVESAFSSGKTIVFWDDALPGFGLKVLPSGQRRYVVKYRTSGGGRAAPQRWYMIGAHGAVTVEQARDMARQVLAAVARGEDPQGNKFALREAATMRELWERYERDHLPRKKASSVRDDRHNWKDFISPALSSRKVHEVTREEVDRLHKRHSERPYQANRMLALLSKMFNLAERWGMRPDGSNPCRHIEKYPEKARERYLTVEEMARLGDALRDGLAAQTENPYMVAAIRLLLLTGARVNEVLKARWEWVDIERRVINLPDSKTGRKTLFLSEPAIEVLKSLKTLTTSEDSPFVLRGRTKDQPLSCLKKPWERICTRAKLVDVRLHDLRHTAATVGVTQGMNLPVIGRLLGHSQASTTQRYAHVDIDPALHAVDKIGSVITNAMGF